MGTTETDSPDFDSTFSNLAPAIISLSMYIPLRDLAFPPDNQESPGQQKTGVTQPDLWQEKDSI